MFLTEDMIHNRSFERRLHSIIVLVTACLFFTLLMAAVPGNRDNQIPGNAERYALFTLLKPDITGVEFRNDVVETELMNPLVYTNAYNGGGVAAGDVNNDGRCDLLFTSNQKGCALYLNMGGMKFEDITSAAGLTGYKGWFTGVTMADVNGDGWLDIYVCRAGKDSLHRANLLFINNQNLKFAERAKEFNLDDTQPSIQGTFFDFDNDDDLDVYIVNHPDNFDNVESLQSYLDASLLNFGKDKLMENVNGRFVDVSDIAGINPALSYGLSASVTDVNNDGFLDLYVANDFFSSDHFYLNNGNKTFTEKTSEFFRQTSLFSMGSDFGDINNDGFMDLIVVDMMPDNHPRMKSHFLPLPIEAYKTLHQYFSPPQYIKNMLQLSNGGKCFSDIAELAGTAKTDWSWNAIFDDLDNDGLNDIFITTGIKEDYFDLDIMQLQDEAENRMEFRHSLDSLLTRMSETKLTNYLFINQGDLNFTDETEHLGLSQKVTSNGAVTADLDNDGDLDLVLNNTGDFAYIYQNLSREKENKNFLRIRLEGSNLNKFGIGARVQVYSGGKTQYKQLGNARGFQACPENILHFGLDTIHLIDSLKVIWLGGSEQTLHNLKPNQLLILRQKDAKPVGERRNKERMLLTEISPKGLDFKHVEDDFTDFKKDRLIPFMISREGPAAAVADVNNDGLEDIFIGGAYNGSKAQLLLQKNDGNFQSMPGQSWQNLNTETTGAVFSDFNKDGYVDLYLANGSNEFDKNDTLLKDRLFLNRSGKTFEDASRMLPLMRGVKTSPLAFDFDGDGDKDLLVCGRMIPGEYPSGGSSYLLRNEGDRFADVTEDYCPALQDIGNVCAAWSGSLNNDNLPDLIVAAEWQPLLFFKNTKTGFVKVSMNPHLDTLRGWWKCVVPGDFNDDGLTDFLIGNQGLNSYLKATPAEPLMLYYNDFDDNKVNEPIALHYLKGEQGFLYDRNMLCEQMPKFRNKFLTYRSYATAKVGDVISQEKLKTSKRFTANFFNSIWIENKGNFHFEAKELPVDAQFATMNSFIMQDLNGDNLPDVIAGGNSESDFYPAGRSLASVGAVWLNGGNGKFQSVSFIQSGFFNREVCRHILPLKIAGVNAPCFLVVNNNAALRVFQLNE